MERINTEILVGSLLTIGFDKIDAVLYTYTLGRLIIDKQKLFDFEEAETSNFFDEIIEYDGRFFRLKQGLSLDTDISTINGFNWPLVNSLPKNNKLIEYLNNLDFSEIILKKMEAYHIGDIEHIDEDRFSHKEIEIIKQLNSNQNNNKILNLKR